LLALGLTWNVVALGAPAQSTNDAQQRALDVLRQTMDGLQQKPTPNRRTAPATVREPTFAEVEQLYLHGKITAKEFQKYLEDHKLDPAKLATSRKETNTFGSVQSTPAFKPDTSGKAREAQTNSSEAVQPPPDQPGLSELEKKMDELLRLKAARENGAATNGVSKAPTSAAIPPAPKTKRERLDALLKLYIDGKIPEADYKDKRAKLIAEPD